MLCSFYLNINLQTVNQAARHLSPVFLATSHTFGFVPHSTRSYWRNNHETINADPKTSSLSSRIDETFLSTSALWENPSNSIPNISVESKVWYGHDLLKYSFQALQPNPSSLPGWRILVDNNVLSHLSISDDDTSDKKQCGTCIHTLCVIIS